MTLTITIDLDNDAFSAYPAEEVGRILRHLAEDSNGNTVGKMEVTK
jgi:hypothetical protein